MELKRFAQRLEEKINKEYTSQRTIDACDGNDWKALSHSIRILLEVKQLLEDGCITFPCIENRFLLRIKQGKISREVIDEFFNKELSNVLEKVQSNELNWKYDEELDCYMIITPEYYENSITAVLYCTIENDNGTVFLNYNGYQYFPQSNDK